MKKLQLFFMIVFFITIQLSCTKDKETLPSITGTWELTTHIDTGIENESIFDYEGRLTIVQNTDNTLIGSFELFDGISYCANTSLSAQSMINGRDVTFEFVLQDSSYPLTYSGLSNKSCDHFEGTINISTQKMGTWEASKN